jgi:hypothetical protein
MQRPQLVHSPEAIIPASVAFIKFITWGSGQTRAHSPQCVQLGESNRILTGAIFPISA